MIIADTSGLLALFNGAEPDHPAVAEVVAGEPDQLAVAAGLVERYRDLRIGLADASLAVLAERYRTRRLLTLDRRHFTVVRPLSGGVFDLLP